MAERRKIVGFVTKLEIAADAAALEAGGAPSRTAVNFSSGETGMLDLSDRRASVWSEVLESQRAAGAPTYVEVDTVTNNITQVLLPARVLVESLVPSESGDAVEVSLHISHAKHFLRRRNANFEQLQARLRKALENGEEVLVTETLDEHEIIDVRDAPEEEAPPFLDRALLRPDAARQFTGIAPARARQLFELVCSRSCDPVASSTSCIPFLFPDDGCWGRAHEMCRLLIADGVQPRKVWIYGSLRVETAHNPRCAVHWGWHVAPTLLVDTGASSQVQVIDPSMFGSPIPQATWVAAQNDPTARLKDSDASVFYRNESGSDIQTDPSYTSTQRVLDHYRNQLKLRSTGPSGPPPYAHCS